MVDTKGLDEVAVRAGLDARLKDTRTQVVLCSTFNQAPSTSVQLLLDHLRGAHDVRVDAGGVVAVLALPRDDEGMAVTKAPVNCRGYSPRQRGALRESGDGMNIDGFIWSIADAVLHLSTTAPNTATSSCR